MHRPVFGIIFRLHSINLIHHLLQASPHNPSLPFSSGIPDLKLACSTNPSHHSLDPSYPPDCPPEHVSVPLRKRWKFPLTVTPLSNPRSPLRFQFHSCDVMLPLRSRSALPLRSAPAHSIFGPAPLHFPSRSHSAHNAHWTSTRLPSQTPYRRYRVRPTAQRFCFSFSVILF